MSDENPLTELAPEKSWELLASQQVGRLATSIAGRPEIFPVNYVVDDEAIVFRTAQGSKLFELVTNTHVAFEADSWDGKAGWSVVLQGEAEVIEGSEAIEHAESLGLKPWIPTVKTNFVRIAPSSVSGRHFVFGDEPELY